jgi:hypothetical protein
VRVNPLKGGVSPCAREKMMPCASAQSWRPFENTRDGEASGSDVPIDGEDRFKLMASIPRVTLYTSLPPRLVRQSRGEDYGEAYQRECINSWREAGFRVVSVNPGCELNCLRENRLDIEFIPSGSSCERTKIGDILSAIRNSGEGVAGIINGDCFLMSPGRAIGNMLEAARGSILLLERMDIDPKTMRATGLGYMGFDAFFFDAQFVSKIEGGDDWTIGEPVWDYWFPLVMHAAGAILKTADVPLIAHLNHERRWSDIKSEASGAKLFRLLALMELEGRLPEALAKRVGEFDARLESGQIDVGTAWRECVIPWLKTFPERALLSAPGSPGDFVCRLLAGMANSNEFRFERQLHTVTFALWLQSTRRAVARIGNRASRRLQTAFLRAGRN